MKELYDNYYQESLSQSKSQNLTIKSFQLIARKYDWNYRHFFDNMPHDASILDIGCGVGQFLFYLKNKGFLNLVGIDISASQVELAQLTQPNLIFHHISNSTVWLSEHANKFDIIVMNDVLEHIPLDELVNNLRAAYRALRTEGKIIIKTVNATYPLGSTARYTDLTHYHAFTEKSITQLLRHSGFKQINCYQEEIGIYNFLFLLKKLIVYLVRGFLRLLTYFSESDWPKIISVNIIAVAKKREEND